MNKALIVHYGNDPQYLAIAWQLAADARTSGEEPIMLDITSTSPRLGDGYNRRVLKAFRRESPDSRFSSLLDEHGIAKADTDSAVLEARAPEGEIDTSISVSSALISIARDPEPRAHRGYWRTFKKTLQQSAVDTHELVERALAHHPDVSTVYVTNGRMPNQRAALDAARHHQKHLRVYEKGSLRDTYWREDHSPLERTKTQSGVDEKLADLTADEALALGEEWMRMRSSAGSEINIYSRFFDDDLDKPIPSTRRTVVGLFTSSQDEFASLGDEWKLQEWADQIAGFDHVLTTLEPRGYSFYLRVHPNFITKSHASFRRERERLAALQTKHPSLTIFWHDEPVNSYGLLERTDAVVVWGSTLGLEANGRGIPVWHLAPTYYDIYADVRQWFSPADDPADLLYTPDRERTLRFLAYLAVRDHALPAEAIEVRQQLTPARGLGTRLAALAASGGAPTAGVAATSIFDSIRHRRASVNLQALRGLLDRRRSAD